MTRAWVLFVLAMDSLCRTIGTSDMYPFVLTRPVIGKLAFIQELVQRERSAFTAGAGGGVGDSRPGDVPLKQSRSNRIVAHHQQWSAKDAGGDSVCSRYDTGGAHVRFVPRAGL